MDTQKKETPACFHTGGVQESEAYYFAVALSSGMRMQ
jgi:hypothetical protein